MSAMASQITCVPIVCSNFCSGVDQRKHQSSASLVSVRRILMDSPHKGSVKRKIFPFDDVIMVLTMLSACPDGFLQYKTRCYIIGPTSATREDAVTHCSDLNAHLPRPPDQETNWFVSALATRYVCRFPFDINLKVINILLHDIWLREINLHIQISYHQICANWCRCTKTLVRDKLTMPVPSRLQSYVRIGSNPAFSRGR